MRRLVDTKKAYDNNNKWDVKLTVIPLEIGALGAVTKGLVQGLQDSEIRGRVESTQTIALSEISQNTEKSP